MDGRGNPKTPLGQLEDKVAVASLKKLEKKTVDTKILDYATHGDRSVRADRDVWKGIWIRIYDKEGKRLAEFIKPASFAKTHPWE